MGNWYVSKPDNDGERELLDRAVKALEAELATKTCNKQIASKLEDAELARDSEETCNNKQVTSKLVASDDAISRQEAKEAVKRASASGTVQMLLMEILDGMPSVNPMPCEDAISRADAEALFRNARGELHKSAIRNEQNGHPIKDLHTRDLMLLNAEQMIHLLPSVTPKQRTGHWIFEEGDGKTCFDGYVCSACNKSFHTHVPYFAEYEFCPHCGADMQESEEQA